MSVYFAANNKLNLQEQDVYGSNRLGIYTPGIDVSNLSNEVSEKLRGNTSYELANHLGNVLVTVSDRKIPVASTGDATLIDHFEADVRTAQDYYPFGMLMPGRQGHSSEGGSWVPGAGSSSSVIKQNLIVDRRINNTPGEYLATQSIEFIEGFESSDGDEFVARISEGTGVEDGGSGSGGTE